MKETIFRLENTLKACDEDMNGKEKRTSEERNNLDKSFFNDKEFEKLIEVKKNNEIVKNNKFGNVVIHLLIVLLGVSIFINVVLVVNNAEMKDKLLVLDNNKSEMGLEIDNLNIKVNDSQNLNDKYDILVSRMLNYLDDRVVFIDGESKHYHRWDCEDLNDKSAVAMDINDAEIKGYTDCPLCKIGEWQKQKFDKDNLERSLLNSIAHEEDRKKELLGKIYK